MNAIASGMIHPAAAPEHRRATASIGSDCAMPHRATSTAVVPHAAAITGYFPSLSPTGPITNWIEPCVIA